MTGILARVTTALGVTVLGLTGCGAGPVGQRGATGAAPRDNDASSTAVDEEGMALYASQATYDGEVYDGASRGDPDRTPELTGVSDTAQMPGCNDTGGSEEPTQDVTVEEIDGIAMTTAVWAMGGLLVRRGETLPAYTDAWYGVPPCDLRDPVTVVGRWLGALTRKKVRFDGDLRPPLHIDLSVEPGQGNPPGLERYTVRIHDQGQASPGLDKHAAEEALWSSRSLLEVEVACDGRRYVAQGFALRS